MRSHGTIPRPPGRRGPAPAGHWRHTCPPDEKDGAVPQGPTARAPEVSTLPLFSAPLLSLMPDADPKLRVVLSYTDDAALARHHSVQLTIPTKWESGPTRRLLDCFVARYNDKRPGGGPELSADKRPGKVEVALRANGVAISATEPLGITLAMAGTRHLFVSRVNLPPDDDGEEKQEEDDEPVVEEIDITSLSNADGSALDPASDDDAWGDAPPRPGMDPEKMLAAYEAKKSRIEEKIVDAWESHSKTLIPPLEKKLKKYKHKVRGCAHARPSRVPPRVITRSCFCRFADRNKPLSEASSSQRARTSARARSGPSRRTRRFLLLSARRRARLMRSTARAPRSRHRSPTTEAIRTP